MAPSVETQPVAETQNKCFSANDQLLLQVWRIWQERLGAIKLFRSLKALFFQWEGFAVVQTEIIRPTDWWFTAWHLHEIFLWCLSVLAFTCGFREIMFHQLITELSRSKMNIIIVLTWIEMVSKRYQVETMRDFEEQLNWIWLRHLIDSKLDIYETAELSIELCFLRCLQNRAGRYEQKFISLYFLADLRYSLYISVFCIWIKQIKWM